MGRDHLFHTDVPGHGPPLLVLHGLGLDHSYLRPWLDGLARAASVVYLDPRGNGRSPDPQDWAHLGLDEWCSDIDAISGRAGAARCFVLGHSVGVFLALEYARRYPHRVSGLVLCAGMPTFDYAERVVGAAAARATTEQLASLEIIFTSAELDDEAYRRHCLTILPLYFRLFPPAYGEQMAAVRFRARAFLHARDTLLARFDARPWLGTITAPALILSGRHDFVTPVAEGGLRLARALQRSELAVFDESGHFPFVEEPERFCEVVGSWLTTHTAEG